MHGLTAIQKRARDAREVAIWEFGDPRKQWRYRRTPHPRRLPVTRLALALA